MTKRELTAVTQLALQQTRTALQTVCDALNEGQRKKLLKDGAVASLLKHFEVVL